MSCQKLTQKQAVLKHLKQHGYITVFIAFKQYGITRLSERIRELEDDGHVIHHVPIARNGKRYMTYSMAEQKRARAA